ncbi:FecR family protein [Bacteroides sp. UBA939]|uniref:FecR family protein n=1 Tax=Bacteroides sp. UBA939 TaxID=1946092 RepID=UPI0025C424D4|nr:FecR domain-containing protein [Bacteroides sp. UBA939]
MKENAKLLLKRFFEGELTEEKKKETSQEEVVSNYLLKQWNQTSDLCQDKEAEKRIWKSITKRCHEKPRLSYSGKYIHLFRAMAAAVAIVLIVAGSLLFTKQETKYLTCYAPNGETLTVTLPDSSTVWLNSGTTIRYPEDFVKNRKVELEGEAFFDVKKHKRSAFSVLFADAKVEVKGTSFNIKSYTDAPIEILLVTGKVDFSVNNSRGTISLLPSEQIIYDKEQNKIIRSKTSPAEQDWRGGVYKFRDKRLDKLIDIINRIYNVNITIERNKYNDLLFSGTIRKSEPLSDVVDKLVISLDLKYRKEGNSIILF